MENEKKVEEKLSEDTKDEVVKDEIKVEDDNSQEKEEKDSNFEKDEEFVSSQKYNQAVRKLREKELKERELLKQLEEKPVTAKKAVKNDDNDDDFFDDDDSSKDEDINKIIEERIKPLQDKLSQKEESERSNQRHAFFDKFPQYQKSENWSELLDVLDNDINPNSKDSHYTQLEKAHRILAAEKFRNSDIDKKKREIASDASTKMDSSTKTDSKSDPVDERAKRLADKMPIGYEFK